MMMTAFSAHLPDSVCIFPLSQGEYLWKNAIFVLLGLWCKAFDPKHLVAHTLWQKGDTEPDQRNLRATESHQAFWVGISLFGEGEGRFPTGCQFERLSHVVDGACISMTPSSPVTPWDPSSALATSSYSAEVAG